MANGWKVTAIIFIILFVLETTFIVWVASVGQEEIEKENECSVNVCSGYDAFIFDSYDDICYCYLDNEIAKEEYIR